MAQDNANFSPVLLQKITVKNLQDASSNVFQLERYLSDNFIQVCDFFTYQKHSDLAKIKKQLNSYIQLNQRSILGLSINNKNNSYYILLLLDVSERLGLISSFSLLYEHLESHNFNVGLRVKAASLYIVNLIRTYDYIDRYKDIYFNLDFSIKTGEDSADRLIATMANYYSLVVVNLGEFDKNKVLILNNKIRSDIFEFNSPLLSNNLINNVIDVCLDDFLDAYKKICRLIDDFSNKEYIEINNKNGFLIEKNTKYCNFLWQVKCDFLDIREISVKKSQELNKLSVFSSLDRGEAIIDNEGQLYQYMHSYGNMHYQKLVKAFEKLPKYFFNNKISIVDWGCGQAIASMAYIDFLSKNSIDQHISTIHLVEPSEVALKRASLHITKFNVGSAIYTVNKDLDSLLDEDFVGDGSSVYLHFFSNVLDMDKFSLMALLNLIDSSFLGINYFVCVSPYINDVRAGRLDAFSSHFFKKEKFRMIESVNNKCGEWINGWTRVVRVFEVNL